VFEFGEDLLDWLQVGAIGRQEPEPCPRGPDCGGHVTAKVVQDDDIAGMQRGDQHLLDISAEDVRVDRAVEDLGRVDPVMAQRSEEGHGIPVAKRGLGEHAMTALTPASQRSHVGLGPCLVNEDKVWRINLARLRAT
jgi:hypothetical protein